MRALVRTLLPALALSTVVATAPAVQAAAPAAPAVRVTSADVVPTAFRGPRPAGTETQQVDARRTATRGSKVIRWARSKAGSPYSYRAAGPNAFDCSGFTMWVFRHVHEQLPHSSAAQVGRTRRIPARAARRGDLVFFHDGGGVHHVGIYAGHHTVWHAPYSGTRVRKERIWTSQVFYGRVR